MFLGVMDFVVFEKITVLSQLVYWLESIKAPDLFLFPWHMIPLNVNSHHDTCIMVLLQNAIWFIWKDNSNTMIYFH